MGRKEDLPSESLEERRIACRERFQEAVAEGKLSVLTEELNEYIKCNPDSYSVLSLIEQGFNCVLENCRPPKCEPGTPTSWLDWHHSFPLSEVIGIVGNIYSLTGEIYRKNSGGIEMISQSLLSRMKPLFLGILNITDAGELVLDDIFLTKAVNLLMEHSAVGRYNISDIKFQRFDYDFRESASKFLTLERKKAVEEKNLLRLWVIAKNFLDSRRDCDRDCAWMTIEEGLRIAQEELFNPEKIPEVLIAGLWFLSSSTEFDFSENGDFTLFENARNLSESAMVVCSVDLLDKEDKEKLVSSRQGLYAQSQISKTKRIVEGIQEVIERLDEFTSGEQKKEREVSSSPAKTTLLARITGKLTRSMGNNEIVEKPKPLKMGSSLQFIDGSSAKVLQVFNGGETVVYKVENNVGRVCAMRVYHGENRGKDFGIERGRFVNALRGRVSSETSRCIPEVYDYKVARDGTIYVSQEFIEGKNLESVSKPMSEEEIKNISHSLILTLAETHNKSVAHMDIKPSNLIIGEDGKLVVIDWDLARKFKDDYSRGATVEYASPEVCLMAGKVNGSADIYSFGVTLYELWTGDTQSVSVVGSSRMPLFKASFEQRFPKINEVPEKWRNIIENCTCLDSQKRPTVEVLLQILK